MTALPLLVVKASLVLAVALAAMFLLRRRSAALRHWILAVGLFAAAAMPALEWVAPDWTLPGLSLADSWSRSSVAASTAATLATPAAATDSADVNLTSMATQSLMASVPWSTWLVAMWLGGAVGALVVLLAGLWRVRRVLKHTFPLTEPRLEAVASSIALGLPARPVRLVEGSNPALLVTCGWWRPTIVLPPGCREWPEDKLRSVLAHEFAHIRRRDWVVQLGAEVVRCVYWFNPLFWLATRRLRQESERACDDAVLNEGIDAASYASHLLDIARAARHSQPLPLALGMAHSTSLEGRVRAMFGERMDRRPVTWGAALLAALCMLAIALPIAASTMKSGDQARLERLPAVAAVAPLLLVPSTPVMTPPAVPGPRVRPPSSQRTESPGSVTQAPLAVADQDRAVVVRDRLWFYEAARQRVPATGSASYSGMVIGVSGLPMAGVPVVLTDPATKAVRSEKTTADGRFAFFNLPAGRYSVTASVPGWATNRHDLALEEGQEATRTFELRIGAFVESATVTAPGPRGGDAAPVPNATPRAQVSSVSPPPRTRLCDSNGRNCLSAPVRLANVPPVYPPDALERRAQGIVILEATIAPDGTVSDIRVLRGIDPALNAAALEAVKRWEYAPALFDDQPMAIIMSVTVNFSIPAN